jgi:transcriptional regulator with XRE-family HTH domain
VDSSDIVDAIGRFPDRLKEAIGEKSVRSFASLSGLSPTVMHQYLAGKSEPTRLALIALANAAEVNLEWLMTGDGPMKKVKGALLMDMDLLYGIIEAVEEYLSERKLILPSKKKLETYRYLYDLFKDTPGVNKEQLERTLRLVA